MPARLPRPASWRLATLRFVHLNLGLMLFGASLAFMLRAGVGLGPWDVFHQGVALNTPLTIGQAMVVAGLLLLIFSGLVARVRPGVGTLLNMALVGPWVDAFLAWSAFPTAEGWPTGAAMFAFGMVSNGLATGLYMTAGLGAGPRDGFALALAKISGRPVGHARTAIEVLVCTAGWALGGAVGVGTVVFALGIGPLMQISLRRLGGLEARYRRASRAGSVPRASPSPGRAP